MNTDRLKRLLSVTLTVAACGCLAILVWHERHSLFSTLAAIRLAPLLVSLAVGSISIALTFLLFHDLVTHYANRPFQRKYTFFLYTAGQLIKHIPGKIWSYLFHINELRGDSAIKVNLHLLAFNSAANVGFAILVLTGYYFNAVIAVMGIPVLLWSLYVLNRFTPLIFALASRLFARVPGITTSNERVPYAVSTRLVVVKAISLSAYIVAWYALISSVVPIDFSQSVVLCALYTIAWFVGMLAIVVPSGIGIREVVFVLIGRAFDLDNTLLVTFGILARFWLVAIDALLGVTGILSFRRKPEPDHA